MKKCLLILLTAYSVFFSFAINAKTPTVLNQSDQILRVITPDWNTPTGTLQRYQRISSTRWRPIGTAIPVVVGKNGMGWGVSFTKFNTEKNPVKKEGDGKSPVGIFKIGTAFGIYDKPPGLKLSYLPVKNSTFCVDDGGSQYYNQIINTTKVTQDWKDGTGEKMATVEPQYHWGAVVQYNTNKPQIGAGSCIFIHVWKDADSGTAGCVAMKESKMEQVLTWLNPTKKPVIVLLPESEYKKRQKDWKLPG